MGARFSLRRKTGKRSVFILTSMRIYQLTVNHSCSRRKVYVELSPVEQEFVPEERPLSPKAGKGKKVSSFAVKRGQPGQPSVIVRIRVASGEAYLRHELPNTRRDRGASRQTADFC